MGINIPHDVVVTTARSIGCTTFILPFIYLGVKVGGFMSRLSSWDDIIAKISSRLSKWKLKTISIGGRFTLMKSVLSYLPLYYFSIFKVPKGILNKMEGYRRNFFNGMDKSDRKLSLIGWKKILASKKNGGLGISSLYSLNRAIDSAHKSSRSSLWLDIICEFQNLSNTGANLFSLVKKVGNCEATSFWDDIWTTDTSLKHLFMRLHSLELNKCCSVAVKMRDSSLISSFRRPPRGGVEEDQLWLLEDIISSFVLSHSSDRWIWRLDSSGDFSVKSARNYIDDSFLPKYEDLLVIGFYTR
ncbi:hypothetical protein Tco_1321677 [Tanacetum coccineum]